MDKHRIALIPMLKSTEVQGIGRHVSYPDPVTKTPRRYRFGIRERAREEEAVQRITAGSASTGTGKRPSLSPPGNR